MSRSNDVEDEDWRDKIAANYSPPASSNGVARAAAVLLAAFCLLNIVLVQTGFAAHGVIADATELFEKSRDLLASPFVAVLSVQMTSALLATFIDAAIAAGMIVAISIRSRAEAEFDGELADADPIQGFLFVAVGVLALMRVTIGLDWFLSDDLRKSAGTYLPALMWTFLAGVIAAYALTSRAPATTSVALMSNTAFTALVTLTLLLLNASL